MSSFNAEACPYGIAELAGCLRKLACPSVECLTEVGTTPGLVEVEHFIHDLLNAATDGGAPRVTRNLMPSFATISSPTL